MSFDLQLVKPYKITQCTGENGKRYYILPNGRKYPSVTTYLASMNEQDIAKWKERVGPEVATATSKRALARGTAVHESLEAYIKGKPNHLAKTPIIYHDMVNQVISFLENRVDQIYGIELPLYSTKLRSAGTCDLFCRMDGVITIGDFKTAEHVKKEAWILNYFLQATTYALMVYERYDIWVPQISIMISTEADGLQVFKKPTKDYVDQVVDFFSQHPLFLGS